MTTKEKTVVKPSKTKEERISEWLNPKIDGLEVLRVDIKSVFGDNYRVNVWALVEYAVSVQKSYFLRVTDSEVTEVV